jgi:hypothetical protein
VAIGLLALGISRLPDRDHHVDTAFAMAWKTWSRALFPRVSFDVAQGPRGEHIMTRARQV